MSTAVFNRKTGKPQQLSFHFAQADTPDMRCGTMTLPKPVDVRPTQTQRTRPTQQTSQSKQSAMPTSAAQMVSPGQLRSIIQTKSDLSTNQSPEATVLNKSLNKSHRVGQVQLGTVLLALLKHYGITDEEIRSELSPVELSSMLGS